MTNSMMTMMLVILLTASLTITSMKKKEMKKMKSSPFECGFKNMNNKGTTMFSIPFFLISLMFLIFDVEILLMCLFPLSKTMEFYPALYFWILVTLILMATLYEWSVGVINWM